MYTDKYLELDSILDSITGTGFKGLLAIHWGIYLGVACFLLLLAIASIKLKVEWTLVLPLVLLFGLSISFFTATLLVNLDEKETPSIDMDDKVVYEKRVADFLQLFSIYTVETSTIHAKVGVSDEYFVKPSDYKLNEINEVTFEYNGETYTENLYLMSTFKEKRDGTFYLTPYLKENLKENQISYDGVMLVYVADEN